MTFNSDDDLMNNMWYDPRVAYNGAISSMPLDNNPRTKEVAVLSMSHMSGLTNQSIDELASIVERYIGDVTINVDPSIAMDKTLVKDYTLSGKQLVIILAPDTGEAMNSVF